jgi:hypothetical protein
VGQNTLITDFRAPFEARPWFDHQLKIQDQSKQMERHHVRLFLRDPPLCSHPVSGYVSTTAAKVRYPRDCSWCSPTYSPVCLNPSAVSRIPILRSLLRPVHRKAEPPLPAVASGLFGRPMGPAIRTIYRGETGKPDRNPEIDVRFSGYRTDFRCSNCLISIVMKHGACLFRVGGRRAISYYSPLYRGVL